MFIWIASLSDWLIYSIFSLDKTTHLAQALNFFVYDSIKIILLLLVITNLMTLLNSYLPIEKIRNYLSKNKLFWLEYLFTSLFGAVTPFCSCSSIPLFIGFIKGGIPLGVTFSFLITSPLVNEVAIAMFLGIFWLKITAIYMISGIVLWMLWWWILWKLKLEHHLSYLIHMRKINQQESKITTKPFLQTRIYKVIREARNITVKIIPYVLLWVAVGGVIHGFVPTGFFESYITKNNPFAVPLAVILGIPMYANAIGVIPIVQALIAKGIPLGTGLAFMMAVVWLSLPEFLILKKVMSTKLLLIFFGVVGVCMMMLGYFFNWVL